MSTKFVVHHLCFTAHTQLLGVAEAHLVQYLQGVTKTKSEKITKTKSKAKELPKSNSHKSKIKAGPVSTKAATAPYKPGPRQSTITDFTKTEPTSHDGRDTRELSRHPRGAGKSACHPGGNDPVVLKDTVKEDPRGM